jgi:hypothetical protein
VQYDTYPSYRIGRALSFIAEWRPIPIQIQRIPVCATLSIPRACVISPGTLLQFSEALSHFLDGVTIGLGYFHVIHENFTIATSLLEFM